MASGDGDGLEISLDGQVGLAVRTLQITKIGRRRVVPGSEGRVMTALHQKAIDQSDRYKV